MKTRRMASKNSPKSLSSERLAGALSQPLDALYVVVGAEPLLGFEACDRIVTAARQAGFSERTVLTVEPGFDWSRIALSASTSSLFGDRQLLEIRIPTGKPGVEGAKALEDLSHRLNDEVLTLVNLPGLEPSALKSKWFMALAAQGTVVHAEQITRDRLPAWIQTRLSAQNQKVTQNGLLFLTERTEGNLLAAFQEIQKLALLYPEGAISDEALREAVMDVARFDIDDLAESLIAKENLRFERTLRGLQERGEAMPLIVWALAETLRGLIRTGSAMLQGKPINQALREAKVWGQRQSLIEKHASRISVNRAQSALQQLAFIDRASKGMEDLSDPWDCLLSLGLNFMNETAHPLEFVRS
jgi:DNA polymerase III subunit delta